MEVKFDIDHKENVVKGVDVHFTPTEFLVLNDAIRRYIDTPNPSDIKLAEQMLDDYQRDLEEEMLKGVQ